MSELITRAAAFAHAAHASQVRRYTGEPYINHCAAVARMVAASEPDEAVAAAWLHDVVEDCGVTWETLNTIVPNYVTRKVWYLTNVPRALGNRAERCRLDRERLKTASGNVQTIKVADLIDNTRTIVEHDPNFAKLYLYEKRRMLDVLHGAEPILRQVAYTVLEEGEATLAAQKETTT